MSPDVAASVRARLLKQAKEGGEEFERTLARFAAERLLFRLGKSAMRDRCILKGACLLAVWLTDPYRATRDVDVLLRGPADDAAIRSVVEEICAVECQEDGLRFDLSGLIVETIRPDEEYSGKRARFRAYLGGARIAVQLDFGVGDAMTMPAVEISYPTMLDSLASPRLNAYPREATIAEKFEAMVKLDTRNSRMKDFHDVWALAEGLEFGGAELKKAVEACFERRETRWTDQLPGMLTPAFYRMPELEARWRHYLAGGTVLVRPPAQFEAIGERIIQFLGPVRESVMAGDEFTALWSAGGPWAWSNHTGVAAG